MQQRLAATPMRRRSPCVAVDPSARQQSQHNRGQHTVEVEAELKEKTNFGDKRPRLRRADRIAILNQPFAFRLRPSPVAPSTTAPSHGTDGDDGASSLAQGASSVWPTLSTLRFHQYLKVTTTRTCASTQGKDLPFIRILVQ
jgi:hypothetical protein